MANVREDLGVQVDRDDELPVGVQLAWRLRALIATGRLPSGERLPGLREMAAQAGVNVNTVRAIYGRLEAEGLLVSRQGSGTFVAFDATEATPLGRIAQKAAAEARKAGLDPREVARLVYGEATGASGDPVGEGTGLPDVGRAADEAAARKELRRQIGRLEAQLASYPEARQERHTHPLLRTKAHVAGVGELEAVRDELISRLRAARENAERAGKRQSRARGRRERIIGEPEANRWRRVAREETGDPGCGEVRSVPRFGPVGSVMGWWRVKVSSGCP
jgi:DNA-binding transcriptional regulator YhcF (GntR family)